MPYKSAVTQREWWSKNKDRYKNDRHFYPSARGRFVAVDGEGWKTTYALLADSEGHSLVRPKGVSSTEAFEWLSFLPERCGKAVYLGYALGYDINHWLRDLSDSALYVLWRDGQVRWEDWWLQWAPTRWFHVKHIPSDRSVRIYDSFPFFQTSFLKACEEWGVDVPQEVREGKAGRQSFTEADLPRIESYNRLELRCLVELAHRLHDGLYSAGIPLNQWYGAGAIATSLLTAHGAKSKIVDTPSEVAQAALSAYFGGRIEAARTGRIRGPIYNLDLRSAYPDSLRWVPNLADGRWERIDPTSPVTIDPFGFDLLRIEWDFPRGWSYYPLPWRDSEGRIFFPRVGRGWYWAPEAWQGDETFPRCVKVLDGWRFVPNNPNERAFPWVEELYEKRRAVGSKTGAGRVLKLGVNALYGKMAQRAGVFSRKPTFRQYEYSGFVTSAVRARIWLETRHHLDSVIAYATDGVYSTDPLTDPSFPRYKNEKLGSWEETTYEVMDIVMPGVYRLLKSDGSWELYGRGYGKNGVPWDRILSGWEKRIDKLTVRVPHFFTLGECLHVSRRRPWVDRKKWRSWADVRKEIRLREPSLKRIGRFPFDPQFGVPTDSAPYDSRRDRIEASAVQRIAPSPSRGRNERRLQSIVEPLEAEA